MKKHNLLMIFLISCSMTLAAEVIAIPGLGKPDSLTLFKGNLYITDRDSKDGRNYYFVNFYDPVTLQKEKEIHRMISYVTGNALDTMRLALLFKQDTRRGPIYHVYNDRLFVEGENCQIFVYDRQGSKLCSFTVHDYEKLEIPEDFKKKVMAYLVDFGAKHLFHLFQQLAVRRKGVVKLFIL